MQTLSQDEARAPKPTTNIRVYEETVADLLEIQVQRYRATGSKPTHADIVERAIQLYRSEDSKPRRAS